MAQTPFEVPQQLRDLAKKNAEQAASAYSQFTNAMATAMEMWFSAVPTSQATDGFEPLQKKAISFANQNADAGVALAKELANAKDMQEIMTIQARFAHSQMQTYTNQAQELGQLMMSGAQKRK